METCRICGKSGRFPRYHVQEMMYGFRDEFPYFQCSECGCLQIERIPLDMARYYPDHYAAFEKPERRAGWQRYLKQCRNRYALFNRPLPGGLLYKWFPHLPLRSLLDIEPHQDWRILDVGCGGGELLMQLDDVGFSDLTGVDPYLDRAGKAPGCAKLIRGEVTDLEEKWDLVMFHHSFEHISNPRDTLNHVSACLRVGGWCLIRIPTVSSFAWETYRENWVQLDAPRHFYLHSKKSMRLLGDEAGLELDHVRYDSESFQFWASEQYAQGLPLLTGHPRPARRTFSRRELRRFERKAKELNRQGRGDQAAFYFRKPGAADGPGILAM